MSTPHVTAGGHGELSPLEKILMPCASPARSPAPSISAVSSGRVNRRTAAAAPGPAPGDTELDDTELDDTRPPAGGPGPGTGSLTAEPGGEP